MITFSSLSSRSSLAHTALAQLSLSTRSAFAQHLLSSCSTPTQPWLSSGSTLTQLLLSSRSALAQLSLSSRSALACKNFKKIISIRIFLICKIANKNYLFFISISLSCFDDNFLSFTQAVFAVFQKKSDISNESKTTKLTKYPNFGWPR